MESMIESSRLRSLTAFGREALAYARQASLLHRDMSPSAPTHALPGDHVVVVIHGLFATAGVLRPLRMHVESETDSHTASFTYAPGRGVHQIARQLGALIADIPSDAHIHLVGHSMGGIVARWFVQELGGDPRIVQSISMGSPFRGTHRARLMPNAAGRDISPDSRVLRRLEEHPNPAVPHLSIVGSEDTVTGVVGYRHGERLVIDDCGHNALLYHPRALAAVASQVRAFRSS